MLRIGLTGGIGSGKSVVANYFAELGVAIIDTDLIAREVVEPGTSALKQIKEYFGENIIDAQGQLDRKKLRELVFQSEKDRLWLEALLHPLIRETVKNRITLVKSSYCILVIPLLIESTPHPLVDRILVVDCPESQQIERTQKRDHLSLVQIQAIMKAQASRAQRLAAADDVIYNDGDLQKLQTAIQKLHEGYLKLANKK